MLTLADTAVELYLRGETAAAYSTFDAFVGCGGRPEPVQLCVFGLAAVAEQRRDTALWCRDLAVELATGRSEPTAASAIRLLDRALAQSRGPAISILQLRAGGGDHDR